MEITEISKNQLLLIPGLAGFVFLFAGVWSLLRPPKTINSLVGYRTRRSMASQEAWNFAQSFSSRLSIRLGFGLWLLATCAVFIGNVGWYGSIVAGLAVLAVPVVLIMQTEHQLKSKFPSLK